MCHFLIDWNVCNSRVFTLRSDYNCSTSKLIEIFEMLIALLFYAPSCILAKIFASTYMKNNRIFNLGTDIHGICQQFIHMACVIHFLILTRQLLIWYFVLFSIHLYQFSNKSFQFPFFFWDTASEINDATKELKRVESSVCRVTIRRCYSLE